MNTLNHNSQKPVRQRFTQILRFASTGAIKVVDISPVVSTSVTFFGSAASNMANLYQQFRLTGLCVTLMPMNELPTATANAQTLIVMGYTPMVSSTSPTTASDISNLSDVCCTSSGVSTPVKFRLSKKQLYAGKVVKWLHTDVTPDPDTGEQGLLFYTTLGTNSTTAEQTWLVQSDWEFRGPVAFGEFFKRVESKEVKIQWSPSFAKSVEPGRDASLPAPWLASVPKQVTQFPDEVVALSDADEVLDGNSG